MSTYTGVSYKLSKNSPVFWPTLYVVSNALARRKRCFVSKIIGR